MFFMQRFFMPAALVQDYNKRRANFILKGYNSYQ